MQTELNNIFFEDTNPRRCGCYVISPQLIGIKYKHALVPLRHIDYQLQIVNSLLNVNLTQKYFNPTEKFLEVAYSLPIVPDSSIYKFIAEFGNIRIEGVVKQKEQAKKEYEKAKIQGKQAVIGSIDANSKDIFNFQIGNIPPKTQFTITISFLQEIKISMSSFYRLQVPCTISPRYMNKVQGIVKVPEYEKIKNDKESSGQPDFKWIFKIDLKTSKKLVFFDSPSHTVDLLSQNQQGTQTIIVMKNSEKPNKDFIFLYTTEDFYLPSYVLGTTDISTTIMVSFIPKFCNMELGDAYKASIQNKPYDIQIQNVKGEYVFFLDRSGSMGGSRIQKAKKSLVLFLKSLPGDSYFNVISFGSSSQRVFPTSMKNDSKKIQQVVKVVEKMTADLGGTEIYQPLQSLLQEKVIQGYPRHIFLLTDGEVSDTEAVVYLVKKKTKYSRVHTIGIGTGASYDLIQGCAKAGKGKYILIADDQDPAEKIIGLLQESLTPLISKVILSYEKQNQIQSIIPNPKSIPYILKDQAVNFYITFPGPLKQQKLFTFQYEDPITKIHYKSEIKIDPKSTNFNQPFVDKMAHFKILKELQNCRKQGKKIEQTMYYVKIKDKKQEAINYSIKHQVLSQFTSFVCISQELVDGKFQQFKNKGTEKIFIQQPSPNQTKYYQKLGIAKPMVPLSSPSNFSQNSFSGPPPPPPPPSGYSMHPPPPPPLSPFVPGYSMHPPPPPPSLFGSMPQNQSGLFSSSMPPPPQSSSFASNNIMSRHPPPPPPPSLSINTSSNKMNQNIFQDTLFGSIRQLKKMAPNNEDPTKLQKQQKYAVGSVVKMQQSEGYWKNKQLIQKLSKNPKQVIELSNKITAEVVITKLVILWLSKNHPQKQYSLIIKKAISWLKKSISQNGIDETKLSIIQSI